MAVNAGSRNNKNNRGDLTSQSFIEHVSEATGEDEDKEWQSGDINQIFNTCDLDGCGYLDKDKLQCICPHLNSDEIDAIFNDLDTNKDNKISLSEFSSGFKSLLSEFVNNEPPVEMSHLNYKQSPSSPSMINDYSENLFSSDKHDAHSQINEVFGNLTCQEQVYEFYETLRNGNSTESVEQFQNILEVFVRDILKYRKEIKRLEDAYKRDKESNDKYLKRFEEDYEREMRLLEEKTRKEEKEKFDQEREHLKQKSNTEISDLKANLQRMQMIEQRYAELKNGEDSAVVLLRNDILKLTQENQTLNSSLNESLTSIAVLQSELSAMKGHLNDRQNQLLHEKQSSSSNYRDKESLKANVQLLVEVNKKLRDDNDNLRASLEGVKVNSSRTPSENVSPSRRNRMTRTGSILEAYWNNNSTNNGSSTPQLMTNQAHVMPLHEKKLNSFDVDSDDLDSGLSLTTLRDITEVESDREQQPSLPSVPATKTLINSKNNRSFQKRDNATDSDEVFDEERNNPKKWPQRSIKSKSSINRSVKTTGTATFTPPSPLLTSTPQLKSEQQTQNLPFDRMYKVVFCGDAAVGKSTLIMRLCKGKFVSSINSTLGVDFQNKQLEIDGKRVAIQLWDTAGQERFRSIAKSYFRRCDGVLLVYDCTYERSFLNVREWIDTVTEATTKKVPVMIVANKIDLRDQMRSEGRRVIEHDDGMKLAKDYGALFIETSAKDGTNSNETLIELARDMRCNEDLEVVSSGMQLDQQAKKSGCCSRF